MATYTATHVSATTSVPDKPRVSRFRLLQIRAFASLLTSLGARPGGRALVSHLRSNSWLRAPLKSLLGFRRTFPSFAAAQAVASRYIPAGHEHPDEVTFHTAISDILRESDYPVLFLLAPIANTFQKVFDLGGSVGNLFYAYKDHVQFSSSLTWLVYDLPFIRPIGERLAHKRGESRIRFTDSINESSGADLFLASGSLHYFEQPLHELLRTLEKLPTHVIINRSPFSRGPDVITIQDNQSFLVPCKLHSRSTLLSGMNSLGYRFHMEWPVHERKLVLPLDPHLSARTYSGFYFRLE